MYLSFKDILLCMIKTLIITAIIVGLVMLVMFDYKMGIGYCNIMNIPKDLALTIISPGMAIEVCILLFVFELFVLYKIIKLSRKVKFIDNFYDFLSLEY